MDDPKPLYVKDLEFREIYADAPESLKQALLEKEQVHPLTNTAQLTENRLAPSNGASLWNRHCYGLFAPGKEVPEVFVYVTLMYISPESDKITNDSAPADIKEMLENPGTSTIIPNAAIFYTISNTKQNSAAREPNGRSVAEELIHRVADHVKHYGVKDYFTLSPVRVGMEEASEGNAKGFATWLHASLTDPRKKMLTPIEQEKLSDLAKKLDLPHPSVLSTIKHAHQHFYTLDEPDRIFFKQLMRDLCAHYLVGEKLPGVGRLPNDVAQFHFGNGAELAAAHYHPSGETTRSDDVGGMGMMVNYRYHPEHLAKRKEAFKAGICTMDDSLKARWAERQPQLIAPRIEIHQPLADGVVQEMARVKE